MVVSLLSSWINKIKQQISKYFTNTDAVVIIW
jgi:hypothetical protein